MIKNKYLSLLFAATLLCNSHVMACGENKASSDCGYDNTSASNYDSSRFVKMNSEYTYQMTDFNSNSLAKKSQFFFHNKDKYLQEGELVIGASMTGIADYQTTNRTGKFGYLMQIPTPTNQVGKRVSEILVHHIQIQASGALTPWLAAYGELLYAPQQLALLTNVDLQRNQPQIRKAFVFVGNKSEYPLYASIGKQDVPFGLMTSVNPFTNSITFHAFSSLAHSAILGFDYNGFNASITGVQGGAQFRAANVPVKKTNVPSKLTNFVADVNYQYNVDSNQSYLIGASYLKGSAYNQDFPVKHFNPGKIYNPAWDVYAQIKWHNITLESEFAKTTKEWPGTHNPNAPLNVFEASKVDSFMVGGKYEIKDAVYHKDVDLSLEYSDFRSGPNGSPWRMQSQIVAGVSSMITPTVKIFVEGIKSQGYAPLNFISGGDDPQNPGTTTSDKSARSYIGLVGIQAAL